MTPGEGKKKNNNLLETYKRLLLVTSGNTKRKVWVEGRKEQKENFKFTLIWGTGGTKKKKPWKGGKSLKG